MIVLEMPVTRWPDWDYEPDYAIAHGALAGDILAGRVTAIAAEA
jgi:hypothetical protein